jgi:hypothetical protein
MVKTFGLLYQVWNFDYHQDTAHDLFEAQLVEDTRILARRRRRGNKVVEVPLSLKHQGEVERYACSAEGSYIYRNPKQQSLFEIEEGLAIGAYLFLGVQWSDCLHRSNLAGNTARRWLFDEKPSSGTDR